jgi:ribonuclease Z
MSTCSIKFLGTSDGLPSAERNHASILLDLGERTYLFDCGEPVSRTLKRNGISYEAIDRLFISHLHADHCGGFLMLMQSCWLEGRQKHLPVHMPAEGIQTFHKLLQTTYLFDGLLPFKLTMESLKAKRPIRDGNIAITPHPTTHLQRLKHDFGKRYKSGFEAFCFEICVGQEKRVGYSADVGQPSDLDPLVSKPLDVLVVELAHFTDAELFEYLHHKPIRKIVLTHLGRKYWKNTEVGRLARRYFGRKQLIIATDGLEVKF